MTTGCEGEGLEDLAREKRFRVHVLGNRISDEKRRLLGAYTLTIDNTTVGHISYDIYVSYFYHVHKHADVHSMHTYDESSICIGSIAGSRARREPKNSKNGRKVKVQIRDSLDEARGHDVTTSFLMHSTIYKLSCMTYPLCAAGSRVFFGF